MSIRVLLLLCAILALSMMASAQRVVEVYRDANAVVYFNPSIDKTKTNWIFSLYSKSWAHARKHFGPFRNNEGGRLKGTFQATAGEGGMAAGVNPRNLDIYMDISPEAVRAGNLYDRPDKKRPNQDMLFDYQVNGISRIIEEANNGMEGSPAFGVWGNKGWTQIAIYDIFLNSGLEKDAEDWRKSKINEPADAATAKNIVYWLRDWWIPIYEAHGKTALLGRFFKLVAENWPKDGNKYKGTMNVGQFVHFFSGAAKKDLLYVAKKALGWEEEDDKSLAKAKKDFPRIRY